MLMRTKLLLSLCLVFLLSIQAYAQFKVSKEKSANPIVQVPENSEDKLVYSLCGNTPEASIAIEFETEEKFYICIPAKQWKGCKITNVEIGIAYHPGKDSYVFISKDMDKEPILKQYYQCDTIPIPEEGEGFIGWKNIPLEKAYTIDSDDDLYIGWYTIQDWGAACAVDWEEPAFNGNLACYKRPGSDEWKYQKLDHNPLIRVTVEGENLPQNHVRVISCYVDQLYYKPGEDVFAEATIKNEGTLPVTSFEITYQLNQNEPETKQITNITLHPMEVYNYSVQTTINEEGKGNLKLTVSNPNAKPDDFPENTTFIDNSFGCLAKGLQKNVLLSEVVSTKKAKCPEATKIIQNAIDKCDRKGNVVWITNHSVDLDEYWIEGYATYEWCYPDAPYIPAANIDHRTISGALMPVGTGTVQTTTEMFLIDENFGDHLENCLNEEDVYFSLGLECEVVDDDALEIKMIAKPAIEGLFPTMQQPAVALLLIENNVVGKQAGVDGDYVHNAVPRAFINDGNPEYAFLGDEIPFPSEGFTLESRYIIPDKSWNIDNLSLVFYVTDANMSIRNAVMCPVKSDPDGLNKEIADNKFTVTCIDGILYIDGVFDKARIFAMSGQILMETNEAKINVSGLTKGIYCVLIQKDNRFVSKKFIIQ